MADLLAVMSPPAPHNTKSHGLDSHPKAVAILTHFRESKVIRQEPLPAGDPPAHPDGHVGDLSQKPAPDGAGEDFRVNFRAGPEGMKNAAIDLEFQFPNWSKTDFLLLPGAAYGGNRFESRQIDYPPVVAGTPFECKNPPLLVNDIPRLSSNAEARSIEFLTGDFSTPAVGVFFPGQQRGWWMFTPQATVWGQSGITFEEDLAAGTAVARFRAPGVREEVRYHCFRTDRPSPDRGITVSDQVAMTLQVRLVEVRASDVAAFTTALAQRRNALLPAGEHTPLIPLSACYDIIEKKYNQDNWDEVLGFYATESIPAPDGKRNWQAGWTGGGIDTAALIVSDHPLTRLRVEREIQFLTTEAVAESGYFRGMLSQGAWVDDSFGKSKDGHWHLLRKSADLLFYLAQQTTWFEANGRTHLGTDLRRTIRGCAEALARLWNAENQLGQFVDERSGDLIVGGSESAAIASAALVRAASLLDEDRWLAIAVEIGESYWMAYLRQGCTTGGPGEILQAPDSESAFGLLQSLVCLAEATADDLWWSRASALADHCSTWCVSYHFNFPQASTFASLGIETTGTVIASVQNKHSSPGICTASGDSLLRLFRATGQERHLELLRQIVRSLPQFLSRADRPIMASRVGPQPAGWICERVNLSDWLEPVGEIFYGTCWCEVSLLLTAVEIPSIYFQPDTGRLVTFDHISTNLVRNDGKNWTLEIRNSTPFPARVRILAETSADAASNHLRPGTVARLKPHLIEGGRTLRVSGKN